VRVVLHRKVTPSHGRLGALGAGDALIVMVTRLDTLARSTRDLLNVWRPTLSGGQASGP
jgi:hypothetical protein